MEARVVSLYTSNALRYGTENQVVSINKGEVDGMEPGMVLSLISQGRQMLDKTEGRKDKVQLPDQANGTGMVFRVFDRISYVLVMDVRRGVLVGDKLILPQHRPPPRLAMVVAQWDAQELAARLRLLRPPALATPARAAWLAGLAGPSRFCGTACSLEARITARQASHLGQLPSKFAERCSAAWRLAYNAPAGVGRDITTLADPRYPPSLLAN